MAKGHNPLFAGMSGKIGSLVIYQQDGQTIMRDRVYDQPRRERGPDERPRVVHDLARLWKRGLSAPQKAAWMMLAARMADAAGAQGAQRVGGYPLFLGVNSNRRVLSLAPLWDCPPVPDIPPFIGPLTLTATVTEAGLSLNLAGADYGQAVAVYAARFAYGASPSPPPDKRFALLGYVPSLRASGQELGRSYAGKWGTPGASATLWLRLAPLSPNGFRGPEARLSAVAG